ncbi:Snake venom metalloproteinase BpirMP [Frankliniella fusca]|uniref:Snake venom metalloproteinase BpirMP n=1 Tax=Frankliniella fusca TaxID=407009 RepID=A0AAE1LMK8_9NEOP|nr:Snake venom metalloproteinase BpirMP [Frankliniella fusca]
MAVIAENEGSPRYGIVGKSVLSEISGFDIARCLDVLMSFHALVNVAKRFAMLWFCKRLREQPYSLYRKFNQVNERLLKITPTSDVARAPRSLKERSDYRGHEWFHWVVEYSIPVLKNLLSARFLNHLSFLVHAVALLMQNSVSKSELGYASRYLLKFVTEIDQLYGPQHVTISVHLLTHLSASVRDFGQPWTHSAFVFESFNHDIKQFVKSSNGVALQICQGVQLKVALKNLEECVKNDMTSSQKDFLQKLKTSNHSLVSPHLVIGGAALLGQPKTISLTANTIRFLQIGGVDCELKSSICVYDRCVLNGELYHSINYSRDTRQCNYITLLETGEVFCVEYFLVAQDCFVVGKIFKRNNVVKLCTQALPHILVLDAEPQPELKCFPASMIQSKLLSFSLDLSENLQARIACINVLQSEMLT